MLEALSFITNEVAQSTGIILNHSISHKVHGDVIGWYFFAIIKSHFGFEIIVSYQIKDQDVEIHALTFKAAKIRIKKTL